MHPPVRPSRPRRQWRPFEEARALARALGLSSFSEWQRWAKSPARPHDIPSNPNLAYPGAWAGYADWLGHHRPWRRFDEARRFVRSLHLDSQKAWRQWAKSPARPPDIPSNPYVAYRGEWVDWPDWLGNRRRGQWRPFAEARSFVHSLGLETFAGWCRWARSPARPSDIPSSPPRVYRGEWAGWSDWLGR